jgi:hypothetical protein
MDGHGLYGANPRAGRPDVPDRSPHDMSDGILKHELGVRLGCFAAVFALTAVGEIWASRRQPLVEPPGALARQSRDRPPEYRPRAARIPGRGGGRRARRSGG